MPCNSKRQSPMEFDAELSRRWEHWRHDHLEADDSDTKLISPSDLRAEAQRLIEEGKMPSLEDLLKAVAEVRQKYGPKDATGG